MALPFLLQMLNGDFEKAVNADNEAEFERHKSVMTEKLAQSIGKRNAEAYVLRLNALLDEKRYDVLLQQPARAGRAVGGLVDYLAEGAPRPDTGSPDGSDQLDPLGGAERGRRGELARLKQRLKQLQEGPGGSFSRAGRALGGLLSGRSESKE
jgi:hypothetical protein